MKNIGMKKSTETSTIKSKGRNRGVLFNFMGDFQNWVLIVMFFCLPIALFLVPVNAEMVKSGTF